MLRIFIRSSEEAQQKFQNYFQNKDWSAIAETAHKLAAPTKHLNATSLYNHLKKLETSVENLNQDEVQGLLEVIHMEINNINLILKQKIGKYEV